MAEGAENEARVVISTDFESFKEFIEYSKKGLDETKNKGKSAFGDLTKEAGDFARFAVGGTILSAGRELVTAITAPLHKGLQEIIGDAEKFRATMTRVAVSTGQDIAGVTKEMNKLSRDTLRTVEDINAFIGQVKGQTGDRKGAMAAVGGASKEAHARGLDSLSEMAPLVGTLQRRWQVGDLEKFFNKQRAGAKKLGLDPNQAAALFERMSPTLADTGMSAEKSGAFSSSLLKMAGGDQDIALKAGQELTQLVQNRASRGYLEKTLGLKQGGLLDDKFRPDTARALDLMQKFQKTRRGQKGLEFVARQHMSPTTAALFSRGMDTMRDSMDQQGAVRPGEDLKQAERRFMESDEGKNQAQDRRIEEENRAMANPLMRAKLEAKKSAGGWGGWLRSKAIGGIGIGGIGALGSKVLGSLGLVKGGAAAGLATGTAAGAVGLAGAAGYGLGTLLDRATGASDRISKGVFELMYDPQTGQRREVAAGAGGMPLSAAPSGSTWAPPPAHIAAPMDPRQQAEIQAKASAEEQRRGSPIPVIIRGPIIMQSGPGPTVGQGGQR